MMSSDIGLTTINNTNHLMLNESMENLNEKPQKLFRHFLLKVIFSTPGLVILVVLYTIVGAFLFPMLEVPLKNHNVMSISKSREDCLRELWTITERLNVLYERNWTQLVHEQLRRFEGTIIAATKNGLIEMATLNEHGDGGIGDGVQNYSSSRWTFSEGLLYSVTVITTIGHGNLTPQTPGGKIFTMLYALIGVPLMLMCLSSLGGILGKSLQTVYNKVCLGRGKNHRKKRKHLNDSEKNDTDSEADHDICRGECNNSGVEQNLNQNSLKSKFAYGKYAPINNYNPDQHIMNTMKFNQTARPLQSALKTDELKTLCNVHTICGQSLINISPKHYFYGNAAGHDSGMQMNSNEMSTVVEAAPTAYSSIKLTSAPGSPQKYQNIQFHLNNANYCSNSIMYHTATVHGVGPGNKYLPKPLPHEISQLMAECDLGKSSTFCSESKIGSGNTNQNDYGHGEDDDDDFQNNAHDTPSRIPLITSSTSSSAAKRTIHQLQMHYQTDQRDHHQRGPHTRHTDNSDLTVGSSNSPMQSSSSSSTPPSTYNQVPITIIIVILVIYIALGTLIFSIWENWSIIDGAYFCFITLTTIGFGGDLIPKKTFRGTSQIQFYVCCAYLLLGLILVAMSFSLLETQLIFKCKRIAVRLKLTKD